MKNDYGKLLFMMGFLFLIPLTVIIFVPEEKHFAAAFLLPAAISFVLGGIIGQIRPAGNGGWESLMEKGSRPVLFIWGYAFLIGAIPFVVAHQLGPIQALFESVSGWTTTGLTVSNVTIMPWIFLFYRSFMQYCGGLGFVIMITMVSHGKQSFSIYSAEGHAETFRPSLRDTARVITTLYVAWLAAGVVLYVICGMPAPDAVCHTMSALSTAGFSTRAESIAAYSGTLIRLITILLMLVGASNFAVILQLCKGRFRLAFRESEFKFMLGVTVVFSVLIAAEHFFGGEGSVGSCLVNALFAVVTTFTTTGYSLTDYSVWPAASLGLLWVLMIIGGCSGSTAGGIKMYRAYLLGRSLILYLRRNMEPASWEPASYYIHQQEMVTITGKTKERLTGFLTLYLATMVAGTILLALAAGCPLSEAFFEFTSALGTVGLSCGLTSPDLPAAALILEMIGMVLGRLEITIVIIGVLNFIRRIVNRFE